MVLGVPILKHFRVRKKGKGIFLLHLSTVEWCNSVIVPSHLFFIVWSSIKKEWGRSGTFTDISTFYSTVTDIISIFHVCIVWIEKSVTRVTDRHHEASRVMPNSDPE